MFLVLMNGQRCRLLQVLLDAVRSTYSAEISPVEARLKEPTPTIEFDKLWYMFRPGVDVYVQSTEDVYACVISQTSQTMSVSTRRPQLNLYMWCLGTDGRRIARLEKYASVGRYSGYTEVTSLPVCPAAIWDAFDGGKRRQLIMDRNQLHLQTLRNGSLYASYDGIDHIDGRRV